MDGLNINRIGRVSEVLDDFRTLQFHIAETPAEPYDPNDAETHGWVLLRQCGVDGHRILHLGADTRVPEIDEAEQDLQTLEQQRAELRQVLLDACSRRHEAQKIWLRQQACLQWVESRDAILQGQQPNSATQPYLQANDQQLMLNVQAVTDTYVYSSLLQSDAGMGRWTAEDPSLRRIQHWLAERI